MIDFDLILINKYIAGSSIMSLEKNTKIVLKLSIKYLKAKWNMSSIKLREINIKFYNAINILFIHS